MKFTMTSVLAAALATFVSGAAIEKRDALPSKFTLTASDGTGVIYPQLMFSGSSLYIGNIKYQSSSEAFVASSGGDGASFTSFHSSPTGSQRLYVFPNESKPISFTIPHSGALPTGAVTTGFSEVNGIFSLDRGNGPESLWKACETDAATYQIYWDGANALPDCISVDLTVGDATTC